MADDAAKRRSCGGCGPEAHQSCSQGASEGHRHGELGHLQMMKSVSACNVMGANIFVVASPGNMGAPLRSEAFGVGLRRAPMA
jgi:hypothetical protein